MSTGLLLLLAFVPGVLIALYIYLRDLREPEPSGQLLLTAVYGAIAFFISRGVGFLLHQFIYTDDTSAASQMISAFVFVGLLGEGFKFLFLRGMTFYNKHFNQPFDGIVYALMAGMGYATAENILYVINGDMDAAMWRMITAAPANAVFAVIMGYFLGQAKMNASRVLWFSVLALLLAAFAHGYYDYFMEALHAHGYWLQGVISLMIVIILTQLAYKKKNKTPVARN